MPENRIPAVDHDCVVLLHGMGRTHFAMRKMASYLRHVGYRVINRSYPSTNHPIEILAEKYLADFIAQCGEVEKTHVVTHSLGGIVLRQYLQTHRLPEGSRVVMLSPPNQGSVLAAALKPFPPYRWLTGPAGQQLAADKHGIVKQFAPVNVSGGIGIITGSTSLTPWFAWLVDAESENDGKVTPEEARLPEMRDFLVLPYNHTFIMSASEVLQQSAFFLQNGHFQHHHEQPPP